MLTKEISEVEKGCGNDCPADFDCLCPTCQAKLSTLKSAQAKFDKFMEEELEFLKLLNSVDNNKIGELIDQRITLFSTIPSRIDELSSKQEGKDE